MRQADDGTAVGEVYRKLGISEATYYNWRKKYAGLTASEMKRLRQLEEENGKSKKIVADPSLDKAMLQDVIRRKTLKPVRQRQMVDHVRSTWRVSVRCACRALPVERSTYHYRYRRAGQDQL